MRVQLDTYAFYEMELRDFFVSLIEYLLDCFCPLSFVPLPRCQSEERYPILSEVLGLEKPHRIYEDYIRL